MYMLQDLFPLLNVLYEMQARGPRWAALVGEGVVDAICEGVRNAHIMYAPPPGSFYQPVSYALAASAGTTTVRYRHNSYLMIFTGHFIVLSSLYGYIRRWERLFEPLVAN